MNNKKGFTLIELLAVIAILMTIIVIITPKVFKQLKNAETVIDKEQLSAIIDASKLYMNQHTELLPQENDMYLIQFQQLKDSGLIKTNQILNPSTKEELTGCVLVKYESNKYKYEYKENNCDKQITVTFNPNGGQVNQTTKNVITGEPYGEMPIPTKEGYTFVGWSTSPTDTNVIYDNNEYSGTCTNGEYNLKQYTVSAPFEEGDVYQVDVDLKGTGNVRAFFYGATHFLAVSRIETSDGKIESTTSDGHIDIPLSNEYRHYTIRYTLGSSGDGSVNKYLLFRLYPGNSGYIKNIKLTKVSKTSTIYTEKKVNNSKMYDNSYLVKLPNEYYETVASDASNYKEIVQYTIHPPFSENDIYELKAEVKGQGILKNFFHGATNYLRVKKVETSQGATSTYGDGNISIDLTNNYEQYTATFTLGNNGDGSVVKYLLFRLPQGNTAYVKNIELKKIYPVEEQGIQTNINLYAVWKTNS